MSPPSRVGRISDPNPCRASTARNVLKLAATDGGEGGSVKIFARSVVNDGEIVIGNGGDGGDAGRGGSAADGGPGQGGGDVHAVAGNGGKGGSLLAAGTDLASTVYSGHGGEGGMVAADAGDGGHGCNGGRTFASVGAPGADGTGGKPPRREPEPGILKLSQGGNGGSAVDRNHHGGAGGDVEIRLPRKRGLSEFTIENYGNGGSGYHGCVQRQAGHDLRQHERRPRRERRSGADLQHARQRVLRHVHRDLPLERRER